MQLKYILAWPIGWTLWGAGHLVSKLMHMGEPLGRLYPIYNRLMLWSCSVSDWGGLKIWGDMVPKPDD